MFELQEKQTFNLEEKAAGSTQFYVGGGWQAPSGSWDLDFSAVAIRDNGSTALAYYGGKSILGGAIRCGEDERSGSDGDSSTGDDEHILIDTSKIPADVNKVALVVNIYNNGDFKQIKKAYMRICNGMSETSPELFCFPLGDGLTGRACEFGFLKRTDNGWEFEATGVMLDGPGSGVQGGSVKSIQQSYGPNPPRASRTAASSGSAQSAPASSGGSSALPLIIGLVVVAAAAAFFLL